MVPNSFARAACLFFHELLARGPHGYVGDIVLLDEAEHAGPTKLETEEPLELALAVGEGDGLDRVRRMESAECVSDGPPPQDAEWDDFPSTYAWMAP